MISYYYPIHSVSPLGGGGGGGGNLSVFFLVDSAHGFQVSYYLQIHFTALNATDRKIRKIIGVVVMNLTFLITTWYKNAHKSLNFGPITPKM